MSYLGSGKLGYFWGKVKDLVGKSDVLEITISSFSSLPKTQSNSNITSDMVATKLELGTPTAQTSEWTITTSNGSLTISGSISGSTTATVYLQKKQ